MKHRLRKLDNGTEAGKYLHIAGFMLLTGIIGTTFKLKKEIDKIEEM